MRTFSALLPPTDALDQLADAIAPLSGHSVDEERLRWSDRANWHLTLAFYGETEEYRLPALDEGLTRAARGVEPFTLRLVGAGAFGRRHLWVGVGGALEPLHRLAAASAVAGRAAGTPGGTPHDAYRPHLTVAYGRGSGRDLDRPLAALAAFEGREWTASSLVLMGAEDRPGEGTRYHVRESWRLGAANGRA
ncbi:2'-5' RNA ligase [Streptomyces zhaozhouensis]|uniref:RNA 2',3'-cyclic phosphodiesterase n=1 Tax=Streptomyces zhaozhouensis TaxID=1300267 RepID=A0A286DYD7_9ACTN|nr:RNA 2',3'-cyclic phosphodiesterase [Streptomyces zhaozhouensis]SOD63640.1 2'-5' RNA ligase [Streptomyces zhaozhouensis]